MKNLILLVIILLITSCGNKTIEKQQKPKKKFKVELCTGETETIFADRYYIGGSDNYIHFLSKGDEIIYAESMVVSVKPVYK